ncbi:MAG: hypothetical protein NC092_05840 [Butyrivibrio sp.]|nr:hypothetical protein [Muribaculum sp.]MCM1552198.1 hypothetical protein [Butyrivibrio sp.]
MRKFLYTLLFLMLFLMCGCSLPAITPYEENYIETLKSWSFQFNEGTNDYSVFFGLLNQKNEAISADVNVDIRIVNEEGEEIYKSTKAVVKSDFDYYTSTAAGEQYLAELRIPAKDITLGKSSNGTVYLTVYGDAVYFDEVNCNAYYCLPISDVELVFDTLPFSIDVKGYDGVIESTLQIDDITYSFEKDYIPQVKVTVSGTKIYGRSGTMPSYDVISYKLYDDEEYVITSGNIYLDSLDQGDKFRDDSITIRDITPGETYKLILSEFTW